MVFHAITRATIVPIELPPSAAGRPRDRGSPSGQRFPLFASPRCGDGLFDPPAALEDLHVDPETLMLSNSSRVEDIGVAYQ